MLITAQRSVALGLRPYLLHPQFPECLLSTWNYKDLLVQAPGTLLWDLFLLFACLLSFPIHSSYGFIPTWIFFSLPAIRSMTSYCLTSACLFLKNDYFQIIVLKPWPASLHTYLIYRIQYFTILFIRNLCNFT